MVGRQLVDPSHDRVLAYGDPRHFYGDCAMKTTMTHWIHWLHDNWWLIGIIALGFMTILATLSVSPGGKIQPGLP